jgi:hypothetical protein
MNLPAHLSLSVLPSLSFALVAPPPPQEPAREQNPEISAVELESHVRFLASDELRGRRTGSEELNRAARYLAREFESYGLEPAGDEGSYLQEMFFVVETWEALPEVDLVSGDGEIRSAVYGQDFRVRQPGGDGSFELIVVTEDDALPELQGDSIALCLDGMSTSKARRWLEAQGVPLGIGLDLLVTFTRKPGKSTTKLPRAGRPRLAQEDFDPSPTPWIEVSPALRDFLLGGELKRIDLRLHHSRELLPTYNVIARLPGRVAEPGKGLADEAIVVSAHYDHIGVMAAERGEPAADGGEPDLIYNGADDDASGVACVLEIAQKFASLGPQERELLFLLATAEELGIIGTSFYLDHPSTPLENTVANLNFEMVGRPDEKAGGVGKLWLSGHERTSLMKTYQANGLDIVADPYPEQNFFSRSDNIVFCRRGIVGQTFSSYNLHQDYHRVSDEVETLDFEHLQGATAAGLEAVRLVADGTITPEWLEGGQPAARGR